MTLYQGYIMDREIINDLRAWKQQPDRMPLLVRGARQVGKTYVVNQFGRGEFENFVVINLQWNRVLDQIKYR